MSEYPGDLPEELRPVWDALEPESEEEFERILSNMIEYMLDTRRVDEINRRRFRKWGWVKR